MDDLQFEAMDEQRQLTRRGFGLFAAAVVLEAGASRLALSPAAARETEPGDDRGGHGKDDPAGDDRGGRGGRGGRRREVEPGDDRGGHGNDDPAGDDRGGRHGRRGRR